MMGRGRVGVRGGLGFRGRGIGCVGGSECGEGFGLGIWVLECNVR